MSALNKAFAGKKRESLSGQNLDTPMDNASDDHIVDNSPLEGRTTHRRTRYQGSSSFRIGSGFGTVKRSSSNAGAQSSQPTTSRQAAKRPSNESELNVRKRSSQKHGSQYRLSSGTLPIGSSSGNRPATPSTSRDSDPTRSSTPIDPGPSSNPNVTRSHGSAIGLATDPAQIVNLALSLSESRRLNSGRAVSGTIPRDRRLSAALQSRSPIPDGRNSPLRVDDRHVRQQGQQDSPTESRASLQPLQSPAPFLDYGDQELNLSELSAGTIVRVEKARQHFELFTEYLRLLSRLPPLHHSTAGSTKHGDSTTAIRPLVQGRAYNPLQYIRNRKVRYRERTAINSEEEGWEDVDRVRDWIDGVVTALKDKEYDGDECVQLPPLQIFGHVAEEPQEFFSSPGRTNTNDTNKPRRPRMDWVMTPSDLLADVAWVEAGKNKIKLEDREGHKLFPADTKFKSVHLTADTPSPDLPPVEHPYNPLYSEGRLPSFTSLGSRDSPGQHRGRRIHKFANSLHLTPDHGAGHSRTGSKSGWRRALGRSKSRSDSSHNDDDEHQLNKSLPSHDSSGQQKTVRTLLPPLDPVVKDSKQPRYDYAGSFSSLDDYASNTMSRPSFDEVESVQQSPSNKMMFPSITANLSNSLSRESSPSRRHPLSLRTSLDRLSKQRQKTDAVQDYSPRVSSGIGAIPDLGPNQPESPASDTLRQRFSHESRVRSQEGQQIDSSPGKSNKLVRDADSKRRGIFKGGRIAELVGNEVSKVGDLIRKKDHQGHSRHSSSASASSASEYIDAEDDIRRKTRPRLSRTPTQSDSGLQSRTDQVDSSRYHIPNLPVFTSSLKPDDTRAGSSLSLEQSGGDEAPGRTSNKEQDTSGSQKADEVAAGRDAPTSTRLRPKLSEVTRNWSLSSRSIPKYSHYYRVDKREILRVRAHILSTGVKAQEICRHANASSSSVAFNPLFGGAVNDPHNPLPYIGNQELATAATKRLLSAFDEGVQHVQNSISKFTVSDFPNFTSDLDRLDHLITADLHSRLREVSTEAEFLTGQLATTSTLAIKQLNDALDKGIRKRKRRFRWVSRFGYVLLEWVLVGVMWWVWTIVMLWKLLRGIWRGTISGIRWVLWL